MEGTESERLTREYISLIEDEDASAGVGRARAWKSMQAGSAYVAGKPQPISYLPRILGKTDRERLSSTALSMHGILEKVIRAYLEDEGIRRLFRLDERVRDLILMPHADVPGPILPYCRLDCFYDEASGSMRFVEFNTDASSGMNKTAESLLAIRGTAPFEAFAGRHALSTDVDRLFSGWVRDFLSMYSGTPGAKADPHIAIVMCADGDGVPMGELERFARAFEGEGASCSVCDARRLSFSGGRLVCAEPSVGRAGEPIDAIWRYCIVVDMLAHWEECRPLVEAVESGIPMIGGFETQVAHDKQLFALMRKPAVSGLLTPQERELVEESVPFTAFLDDPDLDLGELRGNKDRWVVKPTDWYGNVGVFVGAKLSQGDWERAIEGCLASDGGAGYIAQEYCEPARALVVPIRGDAGDLDAGPCEYGCLTGIYVFDGEFAGLYNRLGPGRDVTAPGEYVVAPTLWADLA